MSAAFRLSGRSGKQAAVVGKHAHADPGLLVYAHDAVHRTYAPAYLTDNSGQIDLAGTAVGAATNTVIYDGGDTAAFTAAAVTGRNWLFTGTDVVRTGSAAVDAVDLRNNDTASFTAAAPISSTSVGVVSLYVYVLTWSNRGTLKEFEISLWDNGVQVSATLNMSAYLNTATQRVWQLVTIPWADFFVTSATWDQLRLTCRDIGSGAPPAIYVDDMAYTTVANTGIVEYTFAPRPEETVEIRGIEWDGVNVAKDKVVWDEFWGLTELLNGCTLTVRSGGKASFTLLVKNIFDFGSIAPVRLEAIPSGATGGIIKAFATLATEGLVLDGSRGDSISVTIRDDISSLAKMTVALEAYYLDYSLDE